MMEFIERNDIRPSYYLDNRICRGVLSRLWQLMAVGRDPEIIFKCSRNYVTRFMKNYGYVLRKSHTKRCPHQGKMFQEECEKYLNTLRRIYI